MNPSNIAEDAFYTKHKLASLRFVRLIKDGQVLYHEYSFPPREPETLRCVTLRSMKIDHFATWAQVRLTKEEAMKHLAWTECMRLLGISDSSPAK